MSPSPARFNFDLNLDHAREAELAETVARAMADHAEEEGFRRGLAEGNASAAAEAARALAVAASDLADRALALLVEADRMAEERKAESIDLAIAVGRKLAAHLIARFPEAELAALVAECMPSLDHAPHLVIRCAPDLADRLHDIATERMRTSGFAGRLVVMGDPEIGLGDGRLEWVDGGIVRDIGAVSAEIDQRIATYLAACLATPEGSPSA